MDTLKTWSFTRLTTYETCPYRAKLQYIDKRPEPDTMNRTALDRGTAIHTEAELFCLGTGPMTPNMKRYQAEMEKLRDDYEKGLVEIEQDWGFRIDWSETGWTAPDVWARVKLDAFYRPVPEIAHAIDFKTGRKWGNEIKHGQQGMTYTIASFMRYPELQECTYAFWYFDQPDKPMTRKFTREQAMRVMPSLHKRAVAATTATEFPPKPNKINCRYCPYSPNNGGDSSCEWGIEI